MMQLKIYMTKKHILQTHVLRIENSSLSIWVIKKYVPELKFRYEIGKIHRLKCSVCKGTLYMEKHAKLHCTAENDAT